MTNLFDYLQWRGDLTLKQSPFNEVDGMILARFSYEPFEYAFPSSAEAPLTVEAAARLISSAPDIQNKVILEEDIPLLSALADARRFRHMTLSHYVNQIDLSQQSQFSAITIELAEGLSYIAFRGTDNTLVGWKEDFNMGYLSPVPAQLMAAEYVADIAKKISGSLILGGHSKGGNLAVYAAAFCTPALQERIQAVYNFDGPGFQQDIIDTEGYHNICSRVHTFVPQSSIVGMLLCHEEKYTSVHSRKSNGFLQHDVYSWEVKRDHLIHLETVTNSSKVIDSALKHWLANTSREQREEFIDVIYRILLETNAHTTKELSEKWFLNAVTVLRSIKNLDEETRRAVADTLRSLMKCTRQELMPKNTALPPFTQSES